MDRMGKRWKIIKKIRKKEIKWDINGCMGGEKVVMEIFGGIDGFFMRSCELCWREVKMVVVSRGRDGLWEGCGKKRSDRGGWEKRRVRMCGLGCKGFVVRV